MSSAGRYARHVALAEVGTEGQARIGATRVLLVGVGGLGCPAAEYLASAGVGRLVLNDFDRVDETNLPRQILFAEGDVGALKVDAAAARLRALNGGVEIVCLPDRLDDAGFAAEAAKVDLVLDCTDNFTTRLAVNRACVGASVPLVTGAALRFEGQLAIFANDGSGPCYRCLYSEDDELLGDCQGNGVLAPVPGVIGTLMAVEALKLAIRGPAEAGTRLLLWDALHDMWHTLDVRKDPDCPVCG